MCWHRRGFFVFAPSDLWRYLLPDIPLEMTPTPAPTTSWLLGSLLFLSLATHMYALRYPDDTSSTDSILDVHTHCAPPREIFPVEPTDDFMFIQLPAELPEHLRTEGETAAMDTIDKALPFVKEIVAKWSPNSQRKPQWSTR